MMIIKTSRLLYNHVCSLRLGHALDLGGSDQLEGNRFENPKLGVICRSVDSESTRIRPSGSAGRGGARKARTPPHSYYLDLRPINLKYWKPGRDH